MSAIPPASAANPAVKTVSVGEHVLAWRDVGQGDPVLLLHSGGFSSRQWRVLTEALLPTHRVLVPDLLGYGASSPWRTGEPFHLRQDMEALERLLDDVGGPVHLVGHSYGGFLALRLALTRPGQVRSLTLYEPPAFGTLEDWERDELGLRFSPYDPTLGADEAWLSRFVDAWNGPGAWSALNASTREGFRRVGWKVSEEVNSLMRDTTGREHYATLRVPTLLLGGGLSPRFEQRALAELQGAMPGARLEILPGMGHMGPITHAPGVNALILRHLGVASPPP